MDIFVKVPKLIPKGQSSFLELKDAIKMYAFYVSHKEKGQKEKTFNQWLKTGLK